VAACSEPPSAHCCLACRPRPSSFTAGLPIFSPADSTARPVAAPALLAASPRVWAWLQPAGSKRTVERGQEGKGKTRWASAVWAGLG